MSSRDVVGVSASPVVPFHLMANCRFRGRRPSIMLCRSRTKAIESAGRDSADFLYVKLSSDADVPAAAFDRPRSMIERVDITPRADGNGVDTLLHGDLAGILALGRNDKRPTGVSDGAQVTLVAGTGFEPVTFRL